MNELSKISADLTRLRGLTLILTADKARTGITELIAEQILANSLFVVASSEWLPSYELTRIVRGRTLQVKKTLGHLYTVRASTCYRLLDSLVNISSNGEPILVLDFLHTFYDPDIPLRVRFHKLRACCYELRRLAFRRAVIVMTQSVPVEDYETFFSIIRSVANKTLYLEAEPERVSQPLLF